MNKENFKEIIEQSDIGNHKEYLLQYSRPAIDILKKQEAELRLGCSRFGGAPDLPIGSEWPTYGTKPYRFIGQINFAEIPPTEAGLPAKGLLSLFAADRLPDDDSDPDLEPFEEGYIHGIYIPDPANLETIPPPYSETGGAVVVEFSPTIDIPYDEYQLKNSPFTEEESEIYTELRESLHKSPDYLLGYPSHYSLGYNPTPEGEWVSLLTIDSDDDLEWCWHDGDKLMIFIEAARLKNLDFSSLKADAG